MLAECAPDTPNIVFTRNPSIQYWDGYTGQFCVVYDDFDSTRNPNAQPGEHAEFLTICSNQVYRISMAEAADKKGGIFRSKLVVASSNVPFPRPNNLNAPEALWRRRSVMYDVQVAPEYRRRAGGAVDPDLIPADNSHYRIRRYLDPSNPASALTEPMSYQEMMREVQEQYRLHCQQQERSVRALRNMIDAAIRPRVELADDFQDANEQMQAEGLVDDVMNIMRRTDEQQRDFAKRFHEKLRQVFPNNQPTWLQLVPHV